MAYFSHIKALKELRPHYIADGTLYAERADELLTFIGHTQDYPPTMDYMVDFSRTMHKYGQATKELAGYGIDAKALIKEARAANSKNAVAA